MNQRELAERLRLGRTQAMRAFKAATGMTFREFKATAIESKLNAEAKRVKAA